MTSTFTNSQVAAVFVTAILTIHADHPVLRPAAAGLDAWRAVPGSSARSGRRRTTCTPAWARITKGLGPDLMMQDIVFLACCIPVLWAVSIVGLKKAGEVAVTSSAEHLLARAQGASQPVERRGDDPVSSSTPSPGRSTSQATGTSSEVNNASIAFVDEDGSALSKELFNAFYPPRFQFPETITATEVEDAMDEGRFMFVVVIPPHFERDLRAGRNPDIQVNIDATAMQQAGIGAGYIKNIVNDRIASFLTRTDASPRSPSIWSFASCSTPTAYPPGLRAWWPSSIRSLC